MPAEAFGQADLVADLAQIRRIMQAFFVACSQQEWAQLTEPGGWTLRQLLAHLDAVAAAYQTLLEAAYHDEPVSLPGLQQRTDLPAWNEQTIGQRTSLPATAVLENFLTSLQRASDFAAALSPADLLKPVAVPAYGRPLSIAEMLGAQAAHPGLAHGAQLTNAMGQPPLWHLYPPALCRRQLTRFFCLISACYWPQRGGKLNTAVNFIVRGPDGAAWHLHLSPAGGQYGAGRAAKAGLSLWFRDLNVLCQILTGQLSATNALLTGKVLAWGNLVLGFRLSYLLDPA